MLSRNSISRAVRRTWLDCGRSMSRKAPAHKNYTTCMSNLRSFEHQESALRLSSMSSRSYRSYPQYTCLQTHTADGKHLVTILIRDFSDRALQRKGVQSFDLKGNLKVDHTHSQQLDSKTIRKNPELVLPLEEIEAYRMAKKEEIYRLNIIVYLFALVLLPQIFLRTVDKQASAVSPNMTWVRKADKWDYYRWANETLSMVCSDIQ